MQFFRLFVGVGFVFGSFISLASDTYKKEFEALKASHAFVFDNEANSALRRLQQDITTYKIDKGFFKSIFVSMGCVAVSKEAMPKLYEYVESLCEKGRIKTPFIFIYPNNYFFNAMATKKWWFCGGIMISRDFIEKMDDDELEGAIAHEIGHIVHNHVNKEFFLHELIYFFTLYKMYANDSVVYYSGKDKARMIATRHIKADFIASKASRFIIGKSFEKQADAFACKHGKAVGLIKLFERFIAREHRVDEDFVATRALLDEAYADLSELDYFRLLLRYYRAKCVHSIGKMYLWFYRATPFGAHPSNEKRIKAAEEYIR